MIVDTSALVAILLNEGDAEVYARAINEAESPRISAANLVETAIVVEALAGDGGSRQFDAFLRSAGIAVEPVTEEQAHVARQAWSDYGKGRHVARLNFGDCFAYALAKVTGEPLLFKGEDFRKTDVVPAL
jgi:ribonuclease VapC